MGKLNMKLVITTFAVFLAFLLPAKADWICDSNGTSCYPAPPGAYAPPDIPPFYVDPIYDAPPSIYIPPAYTTRTGRTIHRRPIHTFKVQGTLVARRNCAVIKERRGAFSLLCR